LVHFGSFPVLVQSKIKSRKIDKAGMRERERERERKD